MVAEKVISAEPNMVLEVVNYLVVPKGIQPHETCVKSDIRGFDALSRPHMDKKVFSIGIISSADKGEVMEETPHAEN